MPQLPHSIELHDSRLAAVKAEGGRVTLELRPAYVHKDGKGWTQDADLVITDAKAPPALPQLPARIDDGQLKTIEEPYHNLLNLPLKEEGGVRLTLEMEDSEALVFIGTSVVVLERSERVYVEDFN